MKRKLLISILVAVFMTLAVVTVALAGYYTFCSNVYHNGDKIAKVCVTWNISTSGDQVKANTNGTRSVLFFKSGYTAVLGPQACTPLQVWTDEVVCKSTTKFKQSGWPIGGIKQTCWFDSTAMVCDVRKVLAPETAK